MLKIKKSSKNRKNPRSSPYNITTKSETNNFLSEFDSNIDSESQISVKSKHFSSEPYTASDLENKNSVNESQNLIFVNKINSDTSVIDKFRNLNCASTNIVPLSHSITVPNTVVSPVTLNYNLSNSEESLSSLSDIFENENMAQAAAEAASQVINCLRIPDAVKDLPRFDGNPRLLYEFLNNVEEILALTAEIDGTAYSKILLRAIRNKIEGSANEVLNMYGTPLEWGQIKTNLILHYSDKRNETSLIRDLHTLKQNNDTVEKYYSQIIEIQATMFNHISIHETDVNVIKAKKDLFSEMCLNTFLAGLKEPLGSTIRAMRPESLPVAFSYCIKEQNISYTKHESPSFPKLKPVFPQLSLPSFKSTPFQMQQIHHQQPHRGPYQVNQLQQRLSSPFSQRPNIPNFFNRPNTTAPNRPTLFNRPNFQQRPYPTFNQQPRPFAPNPLNAQSRPKPEPMDTSSGFSHLKQNLRPNNFSNFGSQPQQPKFISKELFNINEGDYDHIYSNDNFHSNLDRYYNYETTDATSEEPTVEEEPEIDETNFQLPGLTDPSDT